MANRCARNLERGEVVIVRMDPSLAVFARAFVCEGGPGMKVAAVGRKIYGHWLDGAGDDVILGTEIDPAETEAWQRERGRFEAQKVWP